MKDRMITEKGLLVGRIKSKIRFKKIMFLSINHAVDIDYNHASCCMIHFNEQNRLLDENNGSELIANESI